MSEKPIKPWTMRTAIAQVAKCDFECQGGPLANNDAWRWLQARAADGPEFWPGQQVYYLVKAEANGVKFEKWTPFYVYGVRATSDTERRYWIYTLIDSLPDGYYSGGKVRIENVERKELQFEEPAQ